MDEMNNMNEVTTEETSNEVTPVVTENNEVQAEVENSGINPLFVLGGAAVVGGVVWAANKLKNRKGEKKVEKEKKPKKHIKFQCPVKIVKDEPEEIEDADFNEVEETEEEN
jgi:hypothetical protein